MSRRSIGVGIALLVTIALGLSYVGWKMLLPPEGSTCQACGRAVHAHSRTIANVGDERQTFCCPACALTLHRQTGQEVHVLEFTDYSTGRKMSPRDTHIVQDSDVNLCLRHEAILGDRREAVTIEFDRCSPSMVVFASRRDAERFVRQHGGRILSFEELALAYASTLTP